jgi:hypothetical protein
MNKDVLIAVGKMCEILSSLSEDDQVTAMNAVSGMFWDPDEEEDDVEDGSEEAPDSPKSNKNAVELIEACIRDSLNRKRDMDARFHSMGIPVNQATIALRGMIDRGQVSKEGTGSNITYKLVG